MRLEELSLQHMIPFISMVGDYRENDPGELAAVYPDRERWDAADFRDLVKVAERERLDWKPGPNRISKSRYVLLDEDGSIAGHALMIFPLDDSTSIEGGNVQFFSPPSKRGALCEVHTLNRMLFEAVRAGLARILVTCREGDEVRQNAIEMNRGELEDVVDAPGGGGGKVRRYWIRFR